LVGGEALLLLTRLTLAPHAEQLQGVVPPECTDVTVSATYVPLVAAGDIQIVAEGDREDVNRRAAVVAAHALRGGFDCWLLVSHGSPFRRIVDVLVGGGPPGEGGIDEPAAGAVVRLATTRARAEAGERRMFEEWWLAPEMLQREQALFEQQPILETFARAEFGWCECYGPGWG
jgi:hypothetical protein